MQDKHNDRKINVQTSLFAKNIIYTTVQWE